MPQKVERRIAGSLVCVAAGVALSFLLAHDPPPEALVAKSCGLRALGAIGAEEVDEASCAPRTLDRGLMLPTGAPTSLGCDEARAVVAQARMSMAAPPAPVDAAKFSEATSDWLDPHGLWSVAPDAPVGPAVRREAAQLLAELQALPGSGPCSAAERVGVELERWSGELRTIFEQGLTEGSRAPAPAPAPAPAAARAGASGPLGEKAGPAPRSGFALASSTPFEEGPITRSARDLARSLGRDAGALRLSYGDVIAAYIDAARDRTAPKLDAPAWSRVVIAAALRAYVPQLDAHGAWAPLDEEISLYDLALETSPPERLWSEMTRTVVGVRIDKGALSPLANGDVVLRIHDVALAGMSVEQAEQLSVLADAYPGAPTYVTVLRQGAPSPIDVVVRAGEGGEGEDSVGQAELPPALDLDMVRYEGGKAAVITIPDVPDDLGTRLENALTRARGEGDVRGVLLDMRGNGGGSTDGAIAALGLFLPKASLFPMRRRDGEVEVERAPDVSDARRWTGPVAVLVDSDSASAAEMIAGAIGSYRRGMVIGDRTYGKGCAQEYLDDDAHAGVLRLTTLLFCLPDGSPVQKVGVLPQIRLTLPATQERESLVTRALGPWKGPDVRDPARVREVPWPAHGGRVGPCRDETICRALRALGAAPAAAR
jgi:carboxyl-terminal processing protease